MKKKTIQFSSGTTDFYFSGNISQLHALCEPASTILLTDKNIYRAHAKQFSKWNTIVIHPGEQHKTQETADTIIRQLIRLKADRKTTLVGAGGGVITDLTGYVASVYMRGIRFGFIPTTLLALVDASIGGKNGVDVGMYKNLVGTIRQPSFILHDLNFLYSLPAREWENGFAEIIKHACIKDPRMFGELEKNPIMKFRKNRNAINRLAERNVLLKSAIVKKDEFEKGERRLLNFGHTLGHAIENTYNLPHGHAVSIGMVYACRISEQLTGFKRSQRVIDLLKRYNLPTQLKIDRKKVFNTLLMDKKREQGKMNYVLLEKIGKGVVTAIELKHLEYLINQV